MSSGSDVGDEALTDDAGGAAPTSAQDTGTPGPVRPPDAFGPDVLPATESTHMPTPAYGTSDDPLYARPAPTRDANNADPGPRRRDRWLWLWPALAVASMAVAGATFGPLGTLLTAVVTVATLVIYVGEEVLSTRLRLGVAVAALVVAAAIVLGDTHGAKLFSSAHRSPATRPQGATMGRLDLRGRHVTARDIAGRDLRGALLSGAVLDGLDLRGRDLRDVNARPASFRHAILEHARLTNANLRGADLQHACMYRADLTGASLDGADATGADATAALIGPAAAANAAVWPAAAPPGPGHVRLTGQSELRRTNGILTAVAQLTGAHAAAG